MQKTLLIIGLLFLASCFSSRVLVAPTQSDVDRVSNKFPDYTLEQLNEGKSLFQQHCKQCHGLKNPGSYNEEQWNSIVVKMAAKANKKIETIDANTQESIRKYLVTMGKRD